MSDFAIRKAKADDQQRIKDIVREVDIDPTNLHWSHFIVGEVNGQIVAIGQVRPFKGSPELGSIATVEGHRSKGYAGEIIRRLIDEWDQPGPLYLECEGNMMEYYKQFGFVPIHWAEPPFPFKFKTTMAAVVSRIFGFKMGVMKLDR